MSDKYPYITTMAGPNPRARSPLDEDGIHIENAIGDTALGSQNTMWMYVGNNTNGALFPSATEAAPAPCAISKTTVAGRPFWKVTSGTGWFAPAPFPGQTAGWIYRDDAALAGPTPP